MNRRVRAAVEALRARATEVLGHATGHHLVGNALGAFVVDEEDEPDPELPTVEESFRARIAADRAARAKHPSYPYEYPDEATTDALARELARLWHVMTEGEDDR